MRTVRTVRKILNMAIFNISGAVEKVIVHMESQRRKQNRLYGTVPCRTLYAVYKRHFHIVFNSVAVASVAFVVVVVAALAPVAASVVVADITFVVVVAAMCMCVCVCV